MASSDHPRECTNGREASSISSLSCCSPSGPASPPSALFGLGSSAPAAASSAWLWKAEEVCKPREYPETHKVVLSYTHHNTLVNFILYVRLFPAITVCVYRKYFRACQVMLRCATFHILFHGCVSQQPINITVRLFQEKFPLCTEIRS